MPRTNTGDFPETSMGLTVKSGATESLDGTGHTLTAGNSDGVDDFVHVEDFGNLDLLLEFAVGEVDLLTEGATVNLNFHNVGLVLAEVELANLGGSEDADGRAVLLDAGEVTVDGAFISFSELVLLGVLGESLLLGVHPVLVHAPLDGDIEVGSPDGGQRAETTGCLNVADESDDFHRGALND